MNSRVACGVCGSESVRKINTYKHFWYCCKKCGSASSTPRQRYPFSSLSPKLVRIVPSLKRLQRQIDMPEVIFDYMASEEHVQRHAEQDVFNKFKRTILDFHRIPLPGKKVLDISGGNGSFAAQLQAFGADVVMTEYNSKAVTYARKRYGICTQRFDFNTDTIDEVFHQRFDLILLRAAIMFCVDLRGFLARLRNVISADGLIIVYDSVVPTLRTLIEWELDDYIVLRLYDPKTLSELFSQCEFTLIGRHDRTAEESRAIQQHRRYSLATLLFHSLYAVPAAIKMRNTDLMERASHFVFQAKRS